MQKLSEILSETDRKTERKARLNLVCMQHEQPNTAQYLYQNSPVCLVSMFLLAVLSHDKIILKINYYIPGKWLPGI